MPIPGFAVCEYQPRTFAAAQSERRHDAYAVDVLMLTREHRDWKIFWLVPMK